MTVKKAAGKKKAVSPLPRKTPAKKAPAKKAPTTGKRAKTGGRKKGTPNKRTQEISERLLEIGGDPLEAMAEIALSYHKEGDRSNAFKCYSEIAPYIHAKRKAIEHSGPDGEEFKLTLIIDD